MTKSIWSNSLPEPKPSLSVACISEVIFGLDIVDITNGWSVALAAAKSSSVNTFLSNGYIPHFLNPDWQFWTVEA